jgi:SAM-dependent methyltransferase
LIRTLLRAFVGSSFAANATRRRPNRHADHYSEWIKTWPDDLWGQTGAGHRNIPGEDSAEALVETLLAHLDLQKYDVLLDLGCGNGALTNLIFEHCAGGVGADGIAPLIATAKSRFENKTRQFLKRDMLDCVMSLPKPERFTKALINGAFQYLWPEDATAVLQQLNKRFTRVNRLVLGLLPDRDHLSLENKIVAIMLPDGIPAGYADDAESPLGIWRTKDEVRRMAAETNWHAEIGTVRGDQGTFRFNAILTRRV